LSSLKSSEKIPEITWPNNLKKGQPISG